MTGEVVTCCRFVGNVAADNSHKWLFKESPNENDPGFISSWNVSIDPQPRAWEYQFNSGIQTIAIISCKKASSNWAHSIRCYVGDLNLVISIQRKFSYLQCVPGIFSLQGPYLPMQQPNASQISFPPEGEGQLAEQSDCTATDPASLPSSQSTWAGTAHKTVLLDLPFGLSHLLSPTMSCSLGALLSKLPSILPSHNHTEAHDATLLSNNGSSNISSTSQLLKLNEVGGFNEIQIPNIKLEPSSMARTNPEEETGSIDPCLGLRDGLGFGRAREGGRALNLV